MIEKNRNKITKKRVKKGCQNKKVEKKNNRT